MFVLLWTGRAHCVATVDGRAGRPGARLSRLYSNRRARLADAQFHHLLLVHSARVLDLDAQNDIRSGPLRNGVPDIPWTTQFAVESAALPNVYAELGTRFA